MTELLTFSIDEVVPDRVAVLQNQGIPAKRRLSPAIETLYARAIQLLTEVAAPVGVLSEISISEFEVVYRGEGQNEPTTPVGDILGRAENLAVFAVTLGERVSRRINECFQSDDPALAAMLDCAASAAADKLAESAQGRFESVLTRAGRATPGTAVLRYSPGYCGWHISGQKTLFEFLRPQQIGICLTKSFLMQPLKSVSGVLIAGPKEIHSFQMSYPFCIKCETRGCRERIRALLAD